MNIGPIVIDIEGASLTEEDRALIKHPLVGGLIHFSRNYETPEQITALNRDIRAIRPDLLIAVDQEGGRVQRFQEGFTRLPAMQQFLPLYRKQPKAALPLVQNCGWLMAVELLAVGIDFSFAPVLDIDDKHCTVIADRSFSNIAEEVTELASAFMAGMREAGMATTGKHFPGHGSVVEDSHHELPCDQRQWSLIKSHDLVPFEQLSASLNAVMPAHIVFPKVDEHPVGFSSHWLQTVLRQELGFKGVIFSDDLTMEGAAVVGSYAERARAALQAGCDMILVCNHREGVFEIITELEKVPELSASNSSLLSMRAKKVWTQEMLASNEKYEQIKALLKAITR